MEEETVDPRSLWDELGDYYPPGARVQWLTLPHPQLDGVTPAELMAKGDFDPLWKIMDRLKADAYI